MYTTIHTVTDESTSFNNRIKFMKTHLGITQHTNKTPSSDANLPQKYLEFPEKTRLSELKSKCLQLMGKAP